MPCCQIRDRAIGVTSRFVVLQCSKNGGLRVSVFGGTLRSNRPRDGWFA